MSLSCEQPLWLCSGDVLSKCITCPRSYHVGCYTGKIRDVFLLRSIRWQCHRCQIERKPGDPDYEFITSAYKKARQRALANNAALGVKMNMSENSMDNTQLLQFLDHQDSIYLYHISQDMEIVDHIENERRRLREMAKYDDQQRGGHYDGDHFKSY